MATVRSAVLADAERILEIYDYYVINTAVTFEYDTPSREEFKKRMERTMSRYPYLVIEKDGVIRGYACAACPETNDKYLTMNSADFHAHMGFVKTGEFRKCGYQFGRWYNMVWMEKIIGKHPVHPEMVTGFPELKVSIRTA